MFKNNIRNQHAEKIEFLPDEYSIEVTRIWCQSMITILQYNEDYLELLNMMNFYVYNAYQKNESYGLPTNYISMSVGDIKKIMDVCGDGSFCCIFPYDYEKVSNEYLEDKLGILKGQIDLLMTDDNIDDAINIILTIDDINLKRLSLIYIKYLYNLNTQKKVEELTNVRRKSIYKINSILY